MIRQCHELPARRAAAAAPPGAVPGAAAQAQRRRQRWRAVAAAAPSQAQQLPVDEVDVAVIGAGIIGLCITRQLLQDELSVALLDAKQPCAGATGAGACAAFHCSADHGQ